MKIKDLREKKLLLTFVSALVAVTGFVFLMLSNDQDKEAYDLPVFEVTQGPLTISVTEAGTIKPQEQIIIKSEIEGRNTILYLIPEGTKVEKGELLVELDSSSLQDQKIDQEIRVQNAEASFIQSRENLEVVRNQATSDIERAELDLRFSKEDLVNYREGEYPTILKEHEAKITLAREELKRAQEKLKWSRVLFDEKYIAESELQADELSVSKAELDLELAESNLKLLKEFTYKRKIDEMESNINQNSMAAERIRRKASANVVQAEADFRARELEFKRQKDKLEKIIEQIGKATIRAPRDGLVVYATSAQFRWHRNVEPLDEGQEVRERQELIHLPTASTFLTEVKIHESNLSKIKIGMPVNITVDAVPDKLFKGRVKKIAPLADPASMFMNPDLKQYNTLVQIEGGDNLLRTGMSCEAEIVVERFTSALYVPIQCVVRIAGRTVVFVIENGVTKQRKVEIGLDNNRMVRIISGLKAGEQVLLAPPLAASINEKSGADAKVDNIPDAVSTEGDDDNGENPEDRDMGSDIKSAKAGAKHRGRSKKPENVSDEVGR